MVEAAAAAALVMPKAEFLLEFLVIALDPPTQLGQIDQSLEGDVVGQVGDLPGLTQASFPSSYHGQRCPPPLGLIAGAEGLSVSCEARQSHRQEEECLFFVAMSRARTYLRF